MVIKALVSAWRSRAAMRTMHNELMEMLNATEWMFATVGKVLFDEVEPDAVSEELYRRDVQVNKTERKIRRQIVEHLAIDPRGDVPACLVLMSVVKDAERIGDYCKNLFEVRAVLGKELEHNVLHEDARAVHAQILGIFAKTRSALQDADGEVATEVVHSAKKVGREIEEKVAAVAASELPVRAAVCRALALRHMKRIHAHLCNIATSVVQPVHKLDYFDEGPLRPPKS